MSRQKFPSYLCEATLAATLAVTSISVWAGPENYGIEEVTVTATKRKENLQDVPVSVTAVTGEELAAKTIFETSDLMGSAPNLQVTSAYSKTQPNFSIRGISVANEFSAATASPVGVYVDEVYQNFRASHGQQIFDLQQVEVIRGPQGTLFGRNTTGGAVSLNTRKPELEGSNGFINIGAGNFNAYSATGAVEVTPVDGVFGARLAGTVQRSDGYTKNPIDGKKYGGTDSYALRLSVAWRPSDALSSNIKFYTAENDSLGDLPYGIGYNENQTNILGYGTRLAGGGGAPLAEDVVESNSGNGYYTKSQGASMTWEYETGDLKFSSITGYDEGDYRVSPFDCDGTALDLCSIRYNSKSTSFNQDFRVVYLGEKIDIVAGAYIGAEKIVNHNEPDFFGLLDPLIPDHLFNPVLGAISPANPALGVLPADGQCAPLNINPNGFMDTRTFFEFLGLTSNCAAEGAPPFTSIHADQRFTIERPSQAIYGELKYRFNDELSLTMGLRYTQDDVDLIDARTIVYSEDGVARATTIPYSFPADLSLPAVSQSESSNEITGRVVLDYKVSDDAMVYMSYSHGYRSGTFNALAYQDIGQIYFLDPETIDAWEVGLKSRWFDDRLQLNGAAFFYDYENQQIADVVGTTSFLRSANGEVSGIELEMIAAVSETVELRASLGMLESSYDDNQRFTPTGLDIGGNDFPNAPDTTMNLGASWDIWTGDDFALSGNFEAKYMGEYYFDSFGDYEGNYPGGEADGGGGYGASQELAGANPDHWLFDARITLESEDISLSLWGKNLTDEFYYVYGLNINAFNQDYFTRGQPRTIGLEARYRF